MSAGPAADKTKQKRDARDARTSCVTRRSSATCFVRTCLSTNFVGGSAARKSLLHSAHLNFVPCSSERQLASTCASTAYRNVTERRGRAV